MQQTTVVPNFFGLFALTEHMEDSFGFKATLFTDRVIRYLPMEMSSLDDTMHDKHVHH